MDEMLNEIVEKSKEQEIQDLKEQLASTDYKVIKNAEAMALGLPLPHDPQELHETKQALRDRINELENNEGENEQ